MKEKLVYRVIREKEKDSDHIPFIDDEAGNFEVIHEKYFCFITDNYQYLSNDKGEQWQGKEIGLGQVENKIKKGDILQGENSKLKVISKQILKNNNYLVLERLV